MNKYEELKEAIINCTDQYADNRIEIAQALKLLNKLKPAINYNRCCLKDSDEPKK
jgi:hypothetical protein